MRFMRSNSTISLLLLVASLLLSSRLSAANPSLEALIPPIGTRGTNFATVARGSSLGNVEEVLFYKTGLRCERIEKINDDEVRLHIAVADDCSLGAHPLRVRSKGGISELRAITVSPYPTIKELNDNGPQCIDPNVTVVGTLGADDVDVYQFAAKAGERISAEAVAVRLGVNLLDTVLTLRDANKKVLMRVDDTPMLNQDPSLSMRAPADGDYFVEITSVGANADADSPYALHIGHFPRPTSVFPLGVRADVESELTFIQNDQPNTDIIRKSVKLPSEPFGLTWLTLIDEGLTCPSPIPIRVTSYANASGDEPFSSQGSSSGAPISLHGRLANEGQFGRHSFKVPQDMEICVEVFASRLGSQLDSIVEVRNQDDELIASGDDMDSHDTRLIFTAKTSDTYVAIVRDKRKQFGNGYTYLLEIVPVNRSITTFLPRRDKLSQSRQTISVPQGNRAMGLLGVRRDRVNGTVQLALENLPSGVRFESPVIADDAYVVPVVFAADASSQTSGSLASVNGSLHNDQSTLLGSFRQVVDLVSGPADAIFQPIVVDRLAVAVTEQVPFTVELTQPATPLSVDGTLAIEVKIHRSVGFDSPVDVVIPLLPEWVDCEAKTRIPSGKDTAHIVLQAMPQANAGKRWPLVVEASVGLGERSTKVNVGAIDVMPTPASTIGMQSISSSLRSLTIDASPAHGSIANISAEVGQTVGFECKLELQDTVPSDMIATVEGLPNRVAVEQVAIQRGAKSIRFRLVLDEDAPTGTYDKLVCRLTGELDGQKVTYCVARNTKLVIAAKGQSQKDELGRPLSPLEALRRRNTK